MLNLSFSQFSCRLPYHTMDLATYCCIVTPSLAVSKPFVWFASGSSFNSCGSDGPGKSSRHIPSERFLENRRSHTEISVLINVPNVRLHFRDSKFHRMVSGFLRPARHSFGFSSPIPREPCTLRLNEMNQLFECHAVFYAFHTGFTFSCRRYQFPHE